MYKKEFMWKLCKFQKLHKPPISMPSFYNGKRFFLTYPRCEQLPNELAIFLGQQAPVASYIIAREQHEDGAHHLHACVEFKQTARADVRWLDFQGHHPNKQDPRKWEACKQYCKKDGDFIEGPEEAVIRAAIDGLPPSEVVKAFTECDKWLDYCVSKRISYNYAIWYWNASRDDSFTITQETVVTGQMCQSLASFAFDGDRHRVLILKGESGCGKTTWAKKNAPLPALFVSHIDTLKRFDKNIHKSIIFDDIDFNHYPRTAQIHLVDYDNPRAIHVRYGTVEIPAQIPRIFTCNADPVTLTDTAIKRRCTMVNVK